MIWKDGTEKMEYFLCNNGFVEAGRRGGSRGKGNARKEKKRKEKKGKKIFKARNRKGLMNGWTKWTVKQQSQNS